MCPTPSIRCDRVLQSRFLRGGLNSNPGIGHFNAALKRPFCAPAKRHYARVTKVARLNPYGPIDVAHPEPLAGNGDNSLNEFVDRDVFGVADVDWSFEIRLHQPINTIDHIVNVGVAAHRLAVAPNLDLPFIRRLRNFAANRAGAFSRPPCQVPSGP